MLPLYSRKLTAAEYGTYNLLLVTAGLISGVVSLGMGTALVRHAVLDADRSPRDYYVTTLLWHAAMAVVVDLPCVPATASPRWPSINWPMASK